MNIGDKLIQLTPSWIIERKIIGINGSGGPWLLTAFKWHDGKVCRESSETLAPETWQALLARADEENWRYEPKA